MKKVITILSITAAIGLSACSHENQLKKQPQEETLRFIRAASQYAEGKMNFKSPGRGDAYLYCMQGELKKDAGFCPKLYNYMIEFADKSNTAFSGISVNDLEDQQFFDSTIKKSSYAFNAIPFS